MFLFLTRLLFGCATICTIFLCFHVLTYYRIFIVLTMWLKNLVNENFFPNVIFQMSKSDLPDDGQIVLESANECNDGILNRTKRRIDARSAFFWGVPREEPPAL